MLLDYSSGVSIIKSDKMNLKAILYFLIDNPIRKIFAIIFAFGLWFFVAIDNNYQYVKNIVVIYENLSDSLIIVDSVPYLTVIFSGRGGSLLSTWAAPPKARCDLDKIKIGKSKISVKDLDIPVGFSDIRTSFNTTSINVKVDKKSNKNIRVRVPIKGSLKEGYSVSEAISLDTVLVTGPKELLRDLELVLTETLTVKNETSSFLKKLKIAESSPLLQISREKVQVEVIIDTTIEKQFTNIPLKLIFTPEQSVFSEKISLDTLIVKGPRNKVLALKKREIDVRIRLTKLSPGEYNLPATIILPDYITPVYSNPKKFKIVLY